MASEQAAINKIALLIWSSNMISSSSASTSTIVMSFVTGVAVTALLVQTYNNINNRTPESTTSPQRRRRRRQGTQIGHGTSLPAAAHEQLIELGTPLLKLQRVSSLLKRNVYIKMESLNPGGTGKDRAALNMIRDAERHGRLPSPISCYSIDQGGDIYSNGYNHNEHDDHRHNHHDLALYEQQEQDDDEEEKRGKHDNDNSKNKYSTSTVSSTISSERELNKMIIEAITSKSSSSWSGGLVVEGTSGSTGIALATLCASRGHACLVVMPDDQAVEKQTILRSLGAVVHVVPTASISNPCHYVNLARTAARIARDKHDIQAVFIDQFENLANFDIHFNMTGPEIWNQIRDLHEAEEEDEEEPRGDSNSGRHSRRTLDAFVMSSGTGGTISGCGHYLKEQNPDIRIVLVDPPGSSLHNKIEYGVAYTSQQQERTIRKHRYDTIAEGIGLDRITQNFSLGLVDCIDKSIRVTDQEAVDMSHWILRMEGLWMGSSSAMNLVGAIRTAIDLPPGSSVVTMMCDGGQRHVTRFWDPEFVTKWGLKWPDNDSIPDCLFGNFGQKISKSG